MIDKSIVEYFTRKMPQALVSLSKEKRIPTGCYHLDLLLKDHEEFAGYGLPRGSIIDIFGPEKSGKTTLALSTLRQASMLFKEEARLRKTAPKACLYLALEGVDVSYATEFVDFYDKDTDKGDPSCLLVRLSTIKEIYKAVNDLGPKLGLVVIDSFQQIKPKAQAKATVSTGDGASIESASTAVADFYTANPTLVTKAMTPLVSYLKDKVLEHGLTMVFLSQVRMGARTLHEAPQPQAARDSGRRTKPQIAWDERTSGGKAKAHLTTLSIGLSPTKIPKVGTTQLEGKANYTNPATGAREDRQFVHATTATIVKDSSGKSRNLRTTIYLNATGGIDNAFPLIQFGLSEGVIEERAGNFQLKARGAARSMVSGRGLEAFEKNLHASSEGWKYLHQYHPGRAHSLCFEAYRV